jgi:putative DNA primase/helicase
VNNRDFYKLLCGKCKDSTISLMTLPDRQIRHYTDDEMDQLAENVIEQDKNANTYFSVWPRRRGISENVRGCSEDTEYATCLFGDLDVAGPAHKSSRLPASKEAAMAYLTGLAKPPSLIVDSGYGLYPFWIFPEPVRLADETIRDKAFGILRGFGNYLLQGGQERGWVLDNVFDPARMLRAPGSYNYKLDTPVLCQIVWESGILYSLDDFASYYKVIPEKHTDPFLADSRTMGSADRLMETCRAVQQMRDDPENVSEPLWHAICSNAVLAPDGTEKFHDWSSVYSNYSADETDNKIWYSLSAKKPCTCDYMRDGLGFPCPEIGCGVKAPIVLAQLTQSEQIQNLLALDKLSVDDVFDPYSLKLMAYAKEHYPADFSRFKLRLKKLGIGTRDFERAVRSEAEKQRPLEFDVLQTRVELKGIDLGEAMTPAGYSISIADGVESVGYSADGPESFLLCASPLVITRRLENIDSGQEKVELAFYRNGKWKRIIAPRSNVFSKNAIIRYADSGLPVSTENAEGVIRFLSAYEVTNTAVIPFTRSISRIGWLGQEFFPCVVRSDITYESDTADMDEIIKDICEMGDYAVWQKTALCLRELPFARAMLAAAFASPLLEPLQHRVGLLHLWHSSRSGKTAGLKFAISVWGNPLKLMGNFNSTAVGLERRAGTLKHLPLGLDELQVLNDKRLSPALVVYSLGNGYGKTRGSKHGGLQDVPTWRNFVISTGEQPLSCENSMDGVNSRVLELYGQPIPDPEFGRQVHQISESNYGFAGPLFIQYMIAEILSDKGRLQSDFRQMRETLKIRFETMGQGDCGAHLDTIAVLALADLYASIGLFGLDAIIAEEEAIKLGLVILDNSKSLEKEDTIERAWAFITDWVAANRKRFCQDSIPCYGSIEFGCVYIIPSELRKTLEEGGFSYIKSIKGFKDRGYISTITDSDGVQRTQHQKRVQGVNTRTICAKMNVAMAVSPEDDFLAAPNVEPLARRYA